MRSRKNPRRNWNTKREGKRGKAKKSWARKGEDKTEKQESNLQMPGLLMTKWASKSSILMIKKPLGQPLGLYYTCKHQKEPLECLSLKKTNEAHHLSYN
jgi:hypothetical protein